MSMSANALFIENVKVVTGLAPILPSSSTPDYVSLKGHHKFTAIIVVDNAATVTGSAITLKQATDVAATAEKALAFATMHANIDTAASDTLVLTTVTSDTFTTTTVDNKNAIYVIDVDASDLDINGGFDCVRVGTGNGLATVVGVIYCLWPAKYGAGAASPTALTD